MKVSETEIQDLQEWLQVRLGALLAHGDHVRALLNAGDKPDDLSEQIIQSAIGVTLAELKPESPPMSPSQAKVWQALLPIIAEHGLLALKAGGLALADDVSMNKKEAADFLGLSVRQLEGLMAKRLLVYHKFGAGKSAPVLFMRCELQKFRDSRRVAAKRPCS